MLFNSLAFLIFFPTVTVLFFLLPHRARWAHLLFASCVFYSFFVPLYLLILAFTIGVDYLAGILIEGAQGRRRRLFLTASIVANVGVLCVFKYWNFANHNLSIGLRLFGIRNAVPMLSFALPIGLSFHTFQAMSYTIEVYRGRQAAERHLGIYALYVMFYPQLVAGPIERPQNMLPQFRVHQTYDPARVASGLKLMAWGMFKKLVIADNLAIVVAAPLRPSAAPSRGPTWRSRRSALPSGSTATFPDTRISRSEVPARMGFKLMTNFDAPYESTSVTEFWRRWHISLSTWFKDYVYIPLGGNRRGAARSVFNKMVVFLLSGLWHGANWTFAAWGALHGIYIVVEQALRRTGGKRATAARDSWFGQAIGGLSTFALVCLAWVFFRAEHISDAWRIVVKILTLAPATEVQAGLGSLDHRVAYLALVPILLALEAYGRRRDLVARVSRLPALPRYAIYMTLVYSTILLRGVSSQFIYFQF